MTTPSSTATSAVPSRFPSPSSVTDISSAPPATIGAPPTRPVIVTSVAMSTDNITTGDSAKVPATETPGVMLTDSAATAVIAPRYIWVSSSSPKPDAKTMTESPGNALVVDSMIEGVIVYTMEATSLAKTSKTIILCAPATSSGI